ncbi:heparin lyase I family protein [Acinetobacter soli]|uniref:heparin lyase I family protein n=1 Tax=Acinetobacter soli TaxID=487316 RepID=UPI003BA21BE2
MDKIVFKASLILIIFFCFNMNLLANSDQIQYADGKLFQVDIDVHNRNGICKGTVQSGIEPILGVNSYYKHIVERCANRAEISMKKMKKNINYWQKWSLYIPDNYSFQASGAHIFSQWAAYPKNPSINLPCQGIGHFIALNRDNKSIEYNLQASNNDTGNGGGFCKKFTLIAYNQNYKGHWLDFIQNGKWTGNSDGYIKIWVRVRGLSNYNLVMDYKGVTWWNDQNSGPYFKMGLYKGISNWKGGNSPAIVMTTSYKLFRTNDNIFNSLINN